MAELPASLPHLASSFLTLRRVEEVLGEAPQAQRVAPTLRVFKENKRSVQVAVQGETTEGTVKHSVFQCVKPWLIPPHRKHSREVLYAGTGKTSFSLFRNCHSSTALSF